MTAAVMTLTEAEPDADLDPYWIRENLAFGERHDTEHVPAHYRDAVVTEPVVVDWVSTLIRSTAAARMTRPHIETGPSLLLLGATGRGKTHQAYGALRALSVSGALCAWQFATAADVYAALRPRPKVDSEEEFLRFARASVLVLDDLGAAKPSEWTEEVNYRLINHRYEHELPTLFTSNVAPAELAPVLGDRVISRLAEMATRVVLTGPDRRRKSA